MGKYRFSSEQRFALWRVYGQKCFYCGQSLTFKEVTIDHILPEYLLDRPGELERIIAEYGLGGDFSINDYCNWVPAHLHCNREKGTMIFSSSPALIKALETVKKHATEVLEEQRRIERSLEKGDLLGRLGVALEKGLVEQEEIASILLRGIGARRILYEPIVVTFGLTLEEVHNSELVRQDILQDYPRLCDWLEQGLVHQLSSSLSHPFYYPEPSTRTGESLSVRLAFLFLDLAELEAFSSPWWRILEIRYYSEVYGDSDWTGQRYESALERALVIDDRHFIELLHRGGLLVGFRQITRTDYRAVAISQDYVAYQSDSYCDLQMWKEILELAGIEDWEIEEALSKARMGAY